ncbi:hypothetical protein D777_02031 [Marinobacter nitratireducens]|uniref:Methyltransferase type 11 domain-containing protein n=1 Tax=Marinobacter nitratireducens TaxID=1137280 RepID=A0A072N389_9GAMM|nr:methyltransferase domain-containing protein [Marinobacter nitratireducens]KEF31682.1 hypothetical protein D777_02031 [Marinobacter nitratireducens]
MSVTDIAALKQQAYSCFEQGDFSGSAALLSQVESLTGSNPSLANDIAVSLFKAGELQKALERFRHAAELQAQSSFLIADNLSEMMGTLIEQKPQPGLLNHLSSTYCPVCQSCNEGFKPLPDMYRQNSEKVGYKHFGKGEMTPRDSYFCSVCGASDRERLYAYWISLACARNKLDKESRLIHFAPESGLASWIKKCGFKHHYTSDYMMSGVDYACDLMNLAFEDGSVDFFICSHVLEHVRDDRKALSELHRVTRPGALGILMVPIIVGLEEIDEDPDETDPNERWRRFGQDDHVRLYNRKGFVDRILESGFKVDLLDSQYFGAATYESMGLKPESTLYIVER